MRVCIHRGAEEIGGNCLELEAKGSRIVLDIGRPLDAALDDELPLPAIPGLATGDDPTLLGVIISHPHADHWGLLPQVAPTIPVIMGKAAADIVREAAFFSPLGADVRPVKFLQNRQSFQLGPFQITPFLMDHSAFDAYALLVEADGQSLFYSGDFRGHGRKAPLFQELLRDPPGAVDVVILEGTQLRSSNVGVSSTITERHLEDKLTEYFRATNGMALVAFSAQNIDRLVTVYRAAVKADRNFVVDLYASRVAQATGNAKIPQPGHDRLRVIVPQNQRVKVKNAEAFYLVENIRGVRVYPEDLAARPHETVLIYRGGLVRDLERLDCLAGARMIWSLWDGYLHEDTSTPMHKFLKRNAIPLTILHTSGHASVSDLRALVLALRPRAVVPMHTEAPQAFLKLFENTVIHHDGEWWEV